MNRKTSFSLSMAKRIIFAALSVCLLFSSAQAGAIPPGAVMLEVPDTGGLLGISTVLPLADGSIVIGGQVQYPGEYRQPYKTDYDDPRYKVRNDAIAMRMDTSGKILWTLRFGDPQADNCLSPIGLLPDGRFLMVFGAYDSSFGNQRFIVGLDGVVEDMLPWRTLASHFPPSSMWMMPQTGYLGGDSSIVDFYYDYHSGNLENPDYTHTREMTLLDFDLNVLWCVDLSPLGSMVGNYNTFEVSDGIMLLGHQSANTSVPRQGYEPAFTSIVKLDKRTGEILWQLTDEPRTNGMVSANALTETPDGSLLFTGYYLEPGQTLGEGEWLSTLTKVTADGTPLWTKRYDHIGVAGPTTILPFEEGYVMACRRQNTWNSFMLLYVDAEGELLGTLAIDEEADRVTTWPLLTVAPDGTVYISSSIQTVYDMGTETRGELIGSYLGILDVAMFSLPE